MNALGLVVVLVASSTSSRALFLHEYKIAELPNENGMYYFTRDFPELTLILLTTC